MSKIFTTAIFLILAPIYLQAQSSQVANEFDPLVSLDVELTKMVRLDFYFGRERDPELSSDKWKASAGASLRLKSLRGRISDDPDRDKHHLLVLAANYEYSRADNAGTVTKENRLTLDATPRYVFGNSKILMSDRNRAEFRWVNGDYRFRYRNRLRFERGFKADKVKLTPYCMGEPYWDSHYNRWSQFRYGGGVQIPISKMFVVDTYYERQHCVTCSASSSQTNIFGLELNIHLNRKE